MLPVLNPGVSVVFRVLKKRAVALAFFLGLFVPTASYAQNITFEDVLARPDDAALNLKYAQQEVASGRLQQAAAALERLLLVQPDWDAVRLYYGVVLYRLGDLNAAKRELRLLEGRGLSANRERERVRYLKLAEDQSKRLRFSARYTLGARLDSNPGFVSDEVVGNFGEESDAAFTGSTQFLAELDVGNRGNYLFLQTNNHINEYGDVNQADFISSRVKAGGVIHAPNLVIKPYFLYGATYLQHDKYRDRFGGGIDANWSLNSQVEFFLAGQAEYEDYDVTSFSSVGSQRDGWRYTGEAGIKWRPVERQIFELKGRYRRKDADFDGFSYDDANVSLRSLTLFGKGRYLSVFTSYSNRDYDRPDDFYSSTITREDDRFYVRGAFGVPLQTMFARADIELPSFFADIVAQIGVSYATRNSNIELLEYNNISGDILFTKRVSF